MYYAYRALTYLSACPLNIIIKKRRARGKEHPKRLNEKKGITDKIRPEGKLIWIHGASVGESQSALILINMLLKNYDDMHILITTGTLTSAQLMENKLPPKALHQFYPFDHPLWVQKFLEHWQPDAALWMESELWPNMLYEIKKRNIPAILINAHMSERSFRVWNRLPFLPAQILSTFNEILCQTEKDKNNYRALGAKNIIVTDNIKYSAAPLSYNQNEYELLKNATHNRLICLYASTHEGEEKLACSIHKSLKLNFPELLTIIVPRHPERRENIAKDLMPFNVNIKFRNKDSACPEALDDIYIADTLGELGLFYALSPIAFIGRTFSNDGGGGHNPIEAAQLNCAILHGPNVQNLQEIFDSLNAQNAAIKLETTEDLKQKIYELLDDPNLIKKYQEKACTFAKQKTSVIDKVMANLTPMINKIQ